MRTRVFQGALGIVLAMLLAGCGASAAGSTCQNAASTAPTINQGLVTIATDHGAYAASAGIAVTVTNKTSTTIYAFDHQAGCTVLALQQQVKGEWVAANQHIAGCGIESVSALVALAPNQPYTATIHAGPMGPVAWPAGTYRLALTYFTSQADATQGHGTIVYSQSLTMVSCGATGAGGASGTPATTAKPGVPIVVTAHP